MFKMIVTGKISRVRRENDIKDGVHSANFLLTENYYDGQQKQRVYDVWVPKFLARRSETLVQDGKYIGLEVADYIIQLDFNSNNGQAFLSLKAKDLFIL